MLDVVTYLPPSQVSVLFWIAWVLLAGYWWWSVGQEAGQGHQPQLAWWNIPALLCLLFAPILEIPTLFGIGAALLLFTEYWPRSYVAKKGRPTWIWPLFGLVLGLGVVIASLSVKPLSLIAFATGMGLILAGGAGVIATLHLPKRRNSSQRTTLRTRFEQAQVPDWPDLSVTLTVNGAVLKNISDSTLTLAGWSPASTNSWLMARDETGKPINQLVAGQTAFLPLHSSEWGLRVWYTPAKQSATRLFSVEWTPSSNERNRILN